MARRATAPDAAPPPAGLSESDRCPHCGVVAGLEETGKLRYRCRVCGGPRVPLDLEGIIRSGKEVAPLRAARGLHVRQVLWQGAAVVLGLLGTATLALGLFLVMVASPGFGVGTLSMTLAALPFFLLVALALRKAAATREDLGTTLDHAWQSVALDALEQGGREFTATELGQHLRLEVPEAERLLSGLELSDRVASRVTDEGDIVYTAAHPAVRVRVRDSDLEPGEEGPPAAAQRDPGDEAAQDEAAQDEAAQDEAAQDEERARPSETHSRANAPRSER